MPLLEQNTEPFTRVSVKRGPYIARANVYEKDNGELRVGLVEVTQLRPALLGYDNLFNKDIKEVKSFVNAESELEAKIQVRRAL